MYPKNNQYFNIYIDFISINIYIYIYFISIKIYFNILIFIYRYIIYIYIYIYEISILNESIHPRYTWEYYFKSIYWGCLLLLIIGLVLFRFFIRTGLWILFKYLLRLGFSLQIFFRLVLGSRSLVDPYSEYTLSWYADGHEGELYCNRLDSHLIALLERRQYIF